MPFITLISKITLQNLTKSQELQATSHKPHKKNQKSREQKTKKPKNQKDTKFSAFYRYLSPSFPHASARHLLQCVIWSISPPIDLRMRWISSVEGDFKFSKGVSCTGIIAMQFIMSAPHCFAFAEMLWTWFILTPGMTTVFIFTSMPASFSLRMPSSWRASSILAASSP